MDTLVTVDEFIKQVWEVENVKITVKQDINHLVRPYNYERLPDDATIDDLEERIHKCLKPFITMI